MSTMFIKVPSTGAAWEAARDLLWPVVAGLGCDVFPGFEKDEGSSARAGYSVYRLAGWDDLTIENDPANMQDSEKLYYNYICDLGNVLEVNTCGADWSGDVYRISIVPASTAGSSAAAGAAPAGSFQYAPAAGADSVQSSDAGAAAAVDPDLVTLRLPRVDVQRVLLAILSIKSKNITEALSLDVDDPRRGACIQYAREWDALRRNIRLQLADYDARRGCAAAPAARRFSIRTRRGLRMICREKHTRTRGRSFDGSSVVLVQKWDRLRDGSMYARTLQGFYGPVRRCGSWREYVQQQRDYALSIRREVSALVSICSGGVA